MYDKVIALSAYERPEYLGECLDGLSNCIGIEDYVLIVRVDRNPPAPPHAGVMELLENFDDCQLEITVNADWHGCNRNMLAVFGDAFTVADYAIGLEDDVVFAPDALCWFEWARQFEHEAFAACALQFTTGIDPTSSYLTKGFTPWGCATWSANWPELEEHWQRREGPTILSWDLVVGQIAGERPCLFPRVSRSTNVGRLNGVHQNEHTAWVFGDMVLADPVDPNLYTLEA